jgi:anti-sigma regulatory factor (Ser/Thr protein kinase)
MIEPLEELTRADERESIELSFPAHPDLVVLARFAAATIAARASFDVEEIEDLRLAVDELFVSLGPLTEQGCVRLELDRTADTVSIVGTYDRFATAHASEDVADGSWERAAELSELLLDSLVDEHGREIRDGKPVAWLRKRRTAAP